MKSKDMLSSNVKLKDMLRSMSSPPNTPSPPKVMDDVVPVLPKMVNVFEQSNVESSSKTPTRILYSPVLRSHGIAMS